MFIFLIAYFDANISARRETKTEFSFQANIRELERSDLEHVMWAVRWAKESSAMQSWVQEKKRSSG